MLIFNFAVKNITICPPTREGPTDTTKVANLSIGTIDCYLCFSLIIIKMSNDETKRYKENPRYDYRDYTFYEKLQYYHNYQFFNKKKPAIFTDGRY